MNMWECDKCHRVFKNKNQPHSCKSIPLAQHFKNKEKAKKIYDQLLAETNEKIGKVKEISLPCCIHFFGKYDFLAALPKKDSLEVRIALDRILKNPRLKVAVPVSAKMYKNCFEINSEKDLDSEFMGWVKESYNSN